MDGQGDSYIYIYPQISFVWGIKILYGNTTSHHLVLYKVFFKDFHCIFLYYTFELTSVVLVETKHGLNKLEPTLSQTASVVTSVLYMSTCVYMCMTFAYICLYLQMLANTKLCN